LAPQVPERLPKSLNSPVSETLPENYFTSRHRKSAFGFELKITLKCHLEFHTYSVMADHFDPALRIGYFAIVKAIPGKNPAREFQCCQFRQHRKKSRLRPPVFHPNPAGNH
jgi:hypothetical protein